MTAIATLTMNPSLHVDVSVERVEAGRKLYAGAPAYEPAGGGISVSRAIRRLGGESLAIHTAGGDAGAQLTRLLRDEEIAALPLAVAAETRYGINALETGSGKYFRFVLDGAPLVDSEWQRVLDTILALDPVPQFLVASGSLPQGVPVDFHQALSVIAAEAGIKLVVDTAGAPLQHAAGPGTYLLKPNLHEIRQLGGGEAFSDFFLEGVARSLVSTGRAQVVAISMGAAGAMAVWNGGSARIAAPAVEAVSVAGAGDSMVAGIVLALTRGLPIEEAVRFGVAAGTAAVLVHGAELCRRDDAERLFEQMKSALR